MGVKRILLSAMMPAIFVQPAQSLEITFWTTDTQPERIETIRTILDDFESVNADVTVVLEGVDENDIPIRLIGAQATGDSPQIIHAGHELLVGMGADGLLNAQTTRSVLEEVGIERFFDGALTALRTPDGTYFGLPFYGWIQGIWYRADWFEEAGLAPPTNWDAIRTAAEFFYEPDEGRYGILVGTQADAYAEQVFTQFALSNGAGQFNPEGELVFDSPEMVEVLEFYVNLAQYAPPGPQTWRARDYYLQGRLAMMFYSTFIMDDLALSEVAAGSLTSENFEELDGGDFDSLLVENTRMVPVIENREAAGYGALTALGILDGHPDELDAARRLTAFLYQTENYVSWLHLAPGGMNPVLRDISGSDVFLADPRGVFERFGRDAVEEINAGLEQVETFSIVEGRLFPESGEIFSSQIIPFMMFQAIWEGLPASEAIASAAEQMREVIND